MNIKDNTVMITLQVLFKLYNLSEVKIFLHIFSIFILKGQLTLKHMDNASLPKGQF